MVDLNIARSFIVDHNQSPEKDKNESQISWMANFIEIYRFNY